jgi:hypothetical protein
LPFGRQPRISVDFSECLRLIFSLVAVAAMVAAAIHAMRPAMADIDTSLRRLSEDIRDREVRIAVKMASGDLGSHGVVIARLAELTMELVEFIGICEHRYAITREFRIQSRALYRSPHLLC